MDKNVQKHDLYMLIGVAFCTLAAPILLHPVGANYPDLLQKLVIFGIFAIGFNILFGLTGYLSFGHAAFIGVGSYVALWSFKLLTMNVIPAIFLSILTAAVFAFLIGFVSLRRSGIYFSILTLAFAQMSYNLAYSVLTPITNGETGLQVRAIASSPGQSLLDGDVRIIDQALGIEEVGIPITNLFGIKMSGYEGFYFCAVIMIVMFYIAQRITRSNFGTMLRAIKSNQKRLNYTGVNTRPYLLSAFVISGMYTGLAGALMAVTDPIAGAERMQWTASGEVVLMTILGGAGTLLGPILGSGLIKYAEQKVSSWNEGILNNFFEWLPDGIQPHVVDLVSLFVGEGWHFTLGIMFMVIVIFLPGGLMEGFRRLGDFIMRKRQGEARSGAMQPGE